VRCAFETGGRITQPLLDLLALPKRREVQPMTPLGSAVEGEIKEVADYLRKNGARE
jgi:hypothetical protein